jgi:glycerol-3-phosphate dehydrogenase
LVTPLPLLIPFYGWRDRWYYGTGLALYDLLAGSRNIGHRRHLSREEAGRLEPDLSLEGLHSAAIYYDCKVHSARLLLENILDAARMGAAPANYVEARSWRRAAGVYEIEAEEKFSGRRFPIRAKKLVDARGPWEGSANLRLVRGSHIIVPRLTRSENAIAHFASDGRIMFVIPWGEDADLSLAGTTDVDHQGTPDDVHISLEEVNYLQGNLRKLFPGRPVDPVAAYASLRPLVASGGKSATETSRSHRIWLDEEGVLKIAGGKYTTYRIMAQEAVDLLVPQLRGMCRTGEAGLGNAIEGITRERMVAHAVEHEMAMRLPDLLYASTYWGHERTWTRDALLPLAIEMAEMLGWDETRVEEEIALVLRMGQVAGRS